MHRSLFPVATMLALLTHPVRGEPVFLGVDANYSLGMEAEGKRWTWDGKEEELFSGMARQGAKGFRVRLWTGEDGANGKNYATSVVRRALSAGMEPYLVIFLSEDWADLMKQPAPDAWKELSLDARAEAVRTYSRDIVQHFRAEGLRSHLYEIGNEIDYGICGVYPGKSTKKTPESLSKRCWPDAVKLIKASQSGVLEADPDAKFLLHISHWWDEEFCAAFFRFMVDNGVRVDYAGLSYFPSSNIGGSLDFAQFGKTVDRVHSEVKCPVIIPEVAYPSTAQFKGQFSRWKKEVAGYPLTPEGQQRWIADFLDFCAHHPAIDSVYYWSPEWSGEGMWKAFALFDPAGSARPAWTSFAQPRAQRPKPLQPAYFELVGDTLLPVPVTAAAHAAAPALQGHLEKHGRVNVDYIQAITNADLVVDGYRVHLRASLSGNLELTAVSAGEKTAAASALPWTKALESLDPAVSQAIIFSRGAESDWPAEMNAWAAQRGLRLVRHPVPADAALKFGLEIP